MRSSSSLTLETSNQDRLKLVVLDANFYWTEQLFSACTDFADVLLLRPMDFRTFKRRYHRYAMDWQPKAIGDGLWEQRICCPPGWLFHYWQFTEQFLANTIRRFQASHPSLLVFNYPYYHSLAQRLQIPSLYYSIDDYQHYWPGREAQTLAIEQQAVQQADMTLCVAQHRQTHLQTILPDTADRIVHIPHGCTQQFMVDQPLTEPRSLPPEISQIQHPISGYIGALNYRFDFQYLVAVATQCPEINFVIGGELPTAADGSTEWWQDFQTAQQLPNVYFIGKVQHDRLGEYLPAFDVLLMLYSDCNFNINACPTKLWDYMGTSRPMVANNVVPEVNLWQEVIHIADQPSEFATKIRFALEQPDWKAQERLNIAKSHTWHHQAQKLHHLLEQRSWLNLKIS
jgi:Glycosyl transferases group 1